MEAIRAAERRWLETGALEDEVAYLLARLRAGDLTHDRLLLAAYLGHPAAGACFGSHLDELAQVQEWLAAQGREKDLVRLEEWIGDWQRASRAYARESMPYLCLTNWTAPRDRGWGDGSAPRVDALERWIHGLSLWGPLVLVRAGLAIGRAVVGHLEGHEVHGQADGVLDRTAAWLICPCAEHRTRVLEMIPLIDPPHGHARPRWASSSIETLAAFARFMDVRHIASVIGKVGNQARRALGGPGGVRASADEDALTANGASLARIAIAEELLPWALRGVPVDAMKVRSLEVARAQADELRRRRARGEIAEWALELLAHAEHPPARLVLGQIMRLHEGGLDRWTTRAAALGREAALHVALAAARGVERCWTDRRPDDRRVPALLRCVDGSLRSGSAIGAVTDALRGVEAAIEELDSEQTEESEIASAAARAVRAAGLTAIETADTTWAVVDAMREARRVLALERKSEQETPTDPVLDEMLLGIVRHSLVATLMASNGAQ